MSAMIRAGLFNFSLGSSNLEFNSKGSKDDGEVGNPF